MLINNPVITGSFTVNGVNVAGITGSSELSSSFLALSASYLTTSASYATASGSLSTRVTNLEATSSTVSASFATTSGSIAGRVTIIEGQDATTGSNNFTAPQQISDVSNAISFTSTASLYTDGGLRVSKNSFVSGTAYFNDVVVYGTSSIEYITSSQVNIGSNIITVNTDTPAIRFGGLSVFDSGSTGLTGSIFWDSEKNHWIYSNPSGSSYNSGMIMSGPRNSGSLGDEEGTTLNALMKGQGGDHITSSQIFDDGTTVRIPGNLQVTGSVALSSALTGTSATFGSSLIVGSTSILYGNVAIKSNSATSYYGLNVIANGNNNFIALNHTGTAGIIETEFSTGGSHTPLQIVTGGSVRLTIATDGAATFSSSGSFGGGTLNGANFIIKGQNGVPATSGTTTTAVLRLSSGTGLYNVLDFGTNEADDYSWIQSTRANSLGTYDRLLLNPRGGGVLIGTTVNNGQGTLQVNGNITAANSLLYFGSSSQVTRAYATQGQIRLNYNDLNTLDISVGNGTTNINSNYFGGGSDNKIILGTYANYTNQLVLNTNGNVLVGTTSDNGYKLQVAGSQYISSYLLVGSGGYSESPISLNAEGVSGNGQTDLMMHITNTKYSSANSSGESRIAFGWANHWGAAFAAYKQSVNLTGFRFYCEQGYNTPVLVYELTAYGIILSVPTYNNTSGGAANVGISGVGEFYRSTSSIKYKKNVQDYNKGLAEVLQLRPVSYEGKSKIDEGKHFAGLIAEEVHDLGLTEFVQYAEDGTPDALAYQNMVALLVKGMQEQQAEIEELKAEINELKNK